MSNLKETAYQTIKKKILSNEWEPNQYLDEKMLCEVLGISRTPVREAISRLEWENLVQLIPKRGIFVTGMSVQSISEVFQARYLIEPLVFEQSLLNIDLDQIITFKNTTVDILQKDPIDYLQLHWLDYDFHNYFTHCCRNGYLARIMDNLSDQFQRIRTLSFYQKQRSTAGAEEHIQLCDLILSGNKAESIDALKSHIRNTEKYFMKSHLQ